MLSSVHIYTRPPYHISTDPGKLDVPGIHRYLSESSYWAKGRSLEAVEKSIGNSLNFGVYLQDEQVGFARIISDFSTFAYLADVYLLPGHQNKGLSKWLMNCIVFHPDLRGLNRIMLGTANAHELYKKYGFSELEHPERWMEKRKSF